MYNGTTWKSPSQLLFNREIRDKFHLYRSIKRQGIMIWYKNNYKVNFIVKISPCKKEKEMSWRWLIEMIIYTRDTLHTRKNSRSRNIWVGSKRPNQWLWSRWRKVLPKKIPPLKMKKEKELWRPVPGGENAWVDDWCNIRKRDWSGEMIHSARYVILEFSNIWEIEPIDYSMYRCILG